MADLQKYGRTANLFDDEIESGYYNDSGVLVSDSTTSHSTTYIPVNGTTYTASGLWYRAEQMANFAVYEWDNNKNWLRRSNRQYPPSSNKITFTIGADTAYITLQVQTEHDNIMLNTGSTALPYEPYLDWLHSLRKLTTATEAVENPLYSDGTAITTYTIKGNTVQNGTPSPQNPVDVNGVGERTENLFDGTLLVGFYEPDINTLYTDNPNYRSFRIQGLPAGQYTISWNIPVNLVRVYYDGVLYENAGESLTSYTVTSSDGDIAFSFRDAIAPTTPWSNSNTVMLNTGSTAKPYEPYGYKIGISSGGVTTNRYLGSTQTVRQIKKAVLTGEEDWSSAGLAPGQTPYFRITHFTLAKPSKVVCTHYVSPNETISVTNQVEGVKVQASSEAEIILVIRPPEFAVWSVDDFKAYLAAQYANGTPVTIWYALAEPTIGIINEPLMKIGDYADTLSNAASIPTTEGANSITVDTTVQPSEFTATWTGWHNANVKEWDGSDWQ